jgi:hypothetical protein
MGGLRRSPLAHALAEPPLPGGPVPRGVVVLGNCCVAPGAKLLSKGGSLVATLYLVDPTDGYDFDTLIVNPADYPAVAGR